MQTFGKKAVVLTLWARIGHKRQFLDISTGLKKIQWQIQRISPELKCTSLLENWTHGFRSDYKRPLYIAMSQWETNR